jgi:hypothetical protein
MAQQTVAWSYCRNLGLTIARLDPEPIAHLVAAAGAPPLTFSDWVPISAGWRIPVRWQRNPSCLAHRLMS